MTSTVRQRINPLISPGPDFSEPDFVMQPKGMMQRISEHRFRKEGTNFVLTKKTLLEVLTIRIPPDVKFIVLRESKLYMDCPDFAPLARIL
jgi:hypothetical protein